MSSQCPKESGYARALVQYHEENAPELAGELQGITLNRVVHDENQCGESAHDISQVTRGCSLFRLEGIDENPDQP